MEKQHVLFLCTGNSARSQMAEAFLRKYGGNHYEVFSAGIEPKGLHPDTVRVMAEAGLDLSTHTSKSLEEVSGQGPFRYLITVCDDAEKNCPAAWHGAAERIHWSFEDPVACRGTEEERLAKFRAVRDQIEQAVLEWLIRQAAAV